MHRIFGDWQMSGILNVTSGNPQNVILGFNRSRDLNVLSASANNDRPNLRAGASTSPVLGGPDRYADSGAFALQPAGTHGNLGRNTLLGPGLVTFDLSLVKNIPFSEAGRVQLRAEFFNLFNHANFGSPNSTAFNNATVNPNTGLVNPNPSFGRITSTATTARQGQIAVKLLF